MEGLDVLLRRIHRGSSARLPDLLDLEDDLLGDFLEGFKHPFSFRGHGLEKGNPLGIQGLVQFIDRTALGKSRLLYWMTKGMASRL